MKEIDSQNVVKRDQDVRTVEKLERFYWKVSSDMYRLKNKARAFQFAADWENDQGRNEKEAEAIDYSAAFEEISEVLGRLEEEVEELWPIMFDLKNSLESDKPEKMISGGVA